MMTRTVLAQTAAAELAPLLRASGIPASDTIGALKEPLDRALRALGVPEADLPAAVVPDGLEVRALAYAAHTIAQRAALLLAPTPQAAAFQPIVSEAAAAARRAGWSELTPIPYAGGIDAADYAANAADPARLPALFSVGVGVAAPGEEW